MAKFLIEYGKVFYFYIHVQRKKKSSEGNISTTKDERIFRCIIRKIFFMQLTNNRILNHFPTSQLSAYLRIKYYNKIHIFSALNYNFREIEYCKFSFTFP